MIVLFCQRNKFFPAVREYMCQKQPLCPIFRTAAWGLPGFPKMGITPPVKTSGVTPGTKKKENEKR